MTNYNLRYTINTIIAAIAMGLWIISVNLVIGGFHIYDLGHNVAANGLWVASVLFFIAGAFVLNKFRKEHKKQKKREDWDDLSKGL